MACLVTCEVYLSNRDKFFAGLPSPLVGFTGFSKLVVVRAKLVRRLQISTMLSLISSAPRAHVQRVLIFEYFIQ